MGAHSAQLHTSPSNLMHSSPAGCVSAQYSDPLVPDKLRAKQHESCPACGSQLKECSTGCNVVCSASLTACCIVEQACTADGCNFVSTFDGSEGFVLRKAWYRSSSDSLGSFVLCFHHEFLYGALEELFAAAGPPPLPVSMVAG